MKNLRRETLTALPEELRKDIDAHITARLIAFYQALIKRGQLSHLPEVREDGTSEVQLFPKRPRIK